MTPVPRRERLPDTRRSVTHRATIHSAQGDVDCYLTVGFYPPGEEGVERVGELFIQVGKAGSTLNALLDTIGILTSFGLQYGIPLAALCRKMRGMRFDPQGATENPAQPSCTSIIDYVFTFLEREYVRELAEPVSFPEETSQPLPPTE